MGQPDRGVLTMQEFPHNNANSNEMAGGLSMRSANAEENSDSFPVGMRVLVVDDDHVCLYLVEALMRRCQYKVTTCREAVTALEMLRENKDRFDLVISDVYMPNMDGFKLLELVDLEMDLPVIMMSAHGETNTVMRGIKHGACDYLLKPVRLEELKNIWQHVVRKRKTGSKDLRHRDDNEKCKPSGDGEHGSSANDDGTDHNSKLNRKRKDPIDNDDEDDENEDPSTLKKPRVVWSVELHQQFVSAVNKLGIDKAVPKRILEHMNVTGLTRENVASHLQKYRLYLKRLSSVGNTFGAREAAFGSLASMDGIDDFHALMQNSQFSVSPLSSLNGGVLGRAVTSSVSLGIPGLNSSAMLPYSSALQGSSSSNRQQRLMQPLNQSHLLSGLPTRLEDQQQQDQISKMGDIGATMDDPARFQQIKTTDDLPLTIGGDNVILKRTLLKELYSGVGPSSGLPGVNGHWGNSSPFLGLPLNTKAVVASPSTSMQNLRENLVINRPMDVRHEMGSQFIGTAFPERDVADRDCSENFKYLKTMDVSLAGPSSLSAINNNMGNTMDSVAIDNIRSKFSMLGPLNAGLRLLSGRNQLQNQEWMIPNQGVGSSSSKPVLGPQVTPTYVLNQKFLGGQSSQAQGQNITAFGDQITNTCIKPPAVNTIRPVFAGNCENELQRTADSQTKLREDYPVEHGKAVDIFLPVTIKRDQIELEEMIRRLKQGGRGGGFPNGSTIGDDFPL